jgi:glycosyltransferase involved in cell wall biosynthesis
MRICHVSAGYHPFVGGAQTYLQAMSERLAGDGHAVTVLTTTATRVDCFWDPAPARVQPGSAQHNGVEVVYCDVGYLPGSPLSFYALRRLAPMVSSMPGLSRVALNLMAPWMPRVPALAKALDAPRPAPDIVHGVNIALEWPLIAAGRHAARRGIPFVATPFVHIGDAAVQRNYTMRHQVAALQAAQAVIAQTALERDALAGLGVPGRRIHCLGMGIDPDETRGGDGRRFRAAHKLADTAPIVGFMGTLTADKGAMHLCEAMRRLWADGSDAVLALAGQAIKPGGFDSYYAALPADARSRIVVTGQLSGQSKQDFLAACDVFAMPSRVDSFGIVYLEAWSYGKPVVGARAGGVPAVIDDGVDGVLAAYGDAADIARALQLLLADAGLRAAMGERGRRKVDERYTWDRIYRQLADIYRGLARDAAGEMVKGGARA